VADGILAIVEKGIWNDDFCLAGYNLSYRDLWSRFAALGGHRKPVWPIGPAIRAIGSWHYDRLAKRSGDESEINSAAIAMGAQCHCYSSDKAKRAFGYSNRPLDQTLNETYAWFRDNGYFERYGIRQR
jgi:dihydroflavonol-4-reductase